MKKSRLTRRERKAEKERAEQKRQLDEAFAAMERARPCGWGSAIEAAGVPVLVMGEREMEYRVVLPSEPIGWDEALRTLPPFPKAPDSFGAAGLHCGMHPTHPPTVRGIRFSEPRLLMGEQVLFEPGSEAAKQVFGDVFIGVDMASGPDWSEPRE